MNNPANPYRQEPHKGKKLVRFKCRIRLRDKPEEAKDVVLDAPDLEAAVQTLWDKGYVVISVEHEQEKKEKDPFAFLKLFSEKLPEGPQSRTSSETKASGWASSFGGSVSSRELIFFAIQLSTLLKAGIPLLRALEVVARGITNTFFKGVLAELRRKVSEGSSFHQALKAQRRIFPWIWVNLVEVGESTGKLPECLEEIALYQGSAARIQGKVVTAFFYPGILSCAVTGALIFLLVFIVPKFTAIFEAQHLQLPILTQMIIGVSNVVRFHAAYVFVVLVGLIVGFLFARKVPRVRMYLDFFRLGFPVFGSLIVQVAVVRFCRSLRTLLRSGVQILQALEISGRLVENSYLELRIRQVSMAVRSGQGLGVQLEARHVFPVFMTQLLAIGEETGQIERFLDILANYYEEQVDTFLVRLTSMLEPILLIFMGGVIGTIVISMFLPIVQLSTGG